MYFLPNSIAKGRWRKGDKPGDNHTVEFDPNGKCSGGLVSLLWFELSHNGQGGNGATAIMGMKDFVRGGDTFAFNGTTKTQVNTPSPYGGVAASSNGTSADDLLGRNPQGFTLNSVWTASMLCKFDGIGSATYTGNLVAISDGVFAHGFGIASGVDQFSLFGTPGIDFTTAPVVTALTGWHRITVGTDGTNSFLYVDAALKQTISSSAPAALTPDLLINGWPWPTADMFLWNRPPNQDLVSEIMADPYGTTMRPRENPQLIKGNLVAAGKKPGILMMGVGP